MKRFMTYAMNRKGNTLVMLAIFLLILLIFASLAIDIAYMYFAKNQLQVAADSAALAGAALLHDNASSADYLIQSTARAKAIEFAGKNTVTGHPVLLVTDNSNTLGNSNDITVGNWDRANNPPYTPGGTPINSLEVQPKKVNLLSGSRGPVRLFLGPIFKLLPVSADWTFMSAKSYAVAAIPPRASSYLTMCEMACYEGGTSCKYPNNPCPLSPGRILSRDPSTPYDRAFSWTSLLDNVTSTTQVQALICNTTPNVDVCGNVIYTTQGEQRTYKDFESVMFDRNIDTGAKECMPSTGVPDSCTNVVGPVVGWTLIIPIATTAYCPPAAQPTPLQIYGYAKIHLTAVCGTGAASGCQSGSAPSSICAPCSGPVAGGKCIIIDSIQCISCTDYANMHGLKPILVR